MEEKIHAALQEARKAGRFGLMELLFALAVPDAACSEEYRAFCAEQEANASPILRAVYADLPDQMDGGNLVFLLRYYQSLHALCADHVIFNEKMDRTAVAAGEERERTARLIFLLAVGGQWDLLLGELASFSEEERALFALWQQERLAVVQRIKEPPLVSVLIPAYNLPTLFARTMRSAAIQDWPNLEIIVADNSTNEETAAEMERYADDSRVRYIRNRTAKSKEENFAVFEQAARGEYLQWLMQDDILLPGKITQMATVLQENPQVSLVASQRAFIDANGMRMDEAFVQGTRPDFGIAGAYASYAGEDVGRAMLCRLQNLIGEPPAVLFRRADLTHHYWRADCRGYRVISDVVMWLELLAHGDLLMFREPLSCYRRHGRQEGQRKDVILESRLEWKRLIEECYARGVFLHAADWAAIRDRVLEDSGRIRAICAAVGGARARAYTDWIQAVQQGLRPVMGA